MPRQERIKTGYPGVFYVLTGKEKVYYIQYRRHGEKRLIEERLSFVQEDENYNSGKKKAMTPSVASRIRSERIKGKVPTNREQRSAKKKKEEVEKSKITFASLWKEFIMDYNKRSNKIRSEMASFKSDESRYNNFILPLFGDKEPSEVTPLDIERLERKYLKENKAQTIKHVLGLLERIAGYGVKKQLCAGISFQIDKPSIDNVVTETLNEDELKALIKALDESDDIQVSHLMQLALYTGMRRGEMFKLLWSDVDFEKGFIFLRSPKGKKSIHIPMNDQARSILESHPRVAKHVFVGEKGKPFSDPRKRIELIRTAAGLPEGFRPLHGLRHVFASMLASSGQVDIYTLQRLLTHKSTATTQRYAHIMDQALKNASGVIVDVMERVKSENGQ